MIECCVYALIVIHWYLKVIYFSSTIEINKLFSFLENLIWLKPWFVDLFLSVDEYPLISMNALNLHSCIYNM